MTHERRCSKFEHVRAVAVLAVFAFVLGTCSGAKNPAGPGSVPAPLAVVSLDTIHALTGRPVEVDVTVRYPGSGVDSLSAIGQLAFHITFDTTALTFLGAVSGPALVGWDYFTWRTTASQCPPCTGPRTIFFIAHKDLGIDSEPLEPKPRPSGVIAQLRFAALSRLPQGDMCLPLRFYSDAIGANALTGEDEVMFIPSSSSVEVDFGPEYDTTKCGIGGTTCKEGLECVSGLICYSDTMRPSFGDLDLDGRPFRNSDTELLEKFFLNGYGMWDNNASVAAQQMALSDVNRDGLALTVSDLEWMERYRSGSIGSGDTNFAEIADTAGVFVGAQTKQFVTLIMADTTISALWLLLSHPDQDSLIPRWVPENIDIPSVGPTIKYNTRSRTTRVLVSNWNLYDVFKPGMTPPRYPITFVRLPNSRINLEAAQASSFPGRAVAVRTGILVNP